MALIKNRSFTPIDSQGKEIPEDGLELFDLIVNDGDVHNHLGGFIPPHWHPEVEFFILEEGVIDLGIGTQIYRFLPGDGCFINSGILHSFKTKTDAPCRYRSYIFAASIVSGTPGSIFDTKYIRPLLEQGPTFFRFHPSQHEPFYTYFDQAYAACAHTTDGYEFDIREAFTKMLLYVREQSNLTSSREISSLQEMRIKHMLSWIEEHLTDEITLSDLAASANICMRECQRLFSNYLHYTPTEYIRHKRLFHAAEQIAATDLPITEIALTYGFATPSYFSKQFKELIGFTPSEYRRSIQKFSSI